MSENDKINRKKFIAGCSGSIIGLGLAVTCGGNSSQTKEQESKQARDDVSAESEQATPQSESRIAFRKLGAPGIEVTEVGFGASRTMDPMVVHHALASGINFIDTGRAYANGQNEYMVGKVIKGRRDQVVINSKIPFNQPEKMQKDLETCLKALGTDYIDCMLIHGASKPEHIQSAEVKELFSRAREQGKLRTFGFSSHSNFIELCNLAADDGFHEVIMVPYNYLSAYDHMLGDSHQEWDGVALDKAISKCGEKGISFISMKGCSGGFKHDGSGIQTYRAALKWILQNPHMKTTATAMGNIQEIEENIQAMGAGALLEQENQWLESYAAAYSGWYCRMCGSCSGQCPQGVDIPQVNRLHMYAVGYGGESARQARKDYRSMITASAAPCEDCSSCSIKCAYGLNLGKKLVDAHILLS